MKHFDRGERKAQEERLKKARKRYWGLKNQENEAKKIGMLLHTPASCSCHMCGNPRKYESKQSIQEQRANQFDKYLYET